MAGRLPFQIELIDVLSVFGPDELSDKFELLPELEDSFFEDGDLPGGPFLED